MPITLSTRDVVKIGSIAAAATAIGAFALGAWTHIEPYTQSDPPPYAGRASVVAEDAKIEQLAADFHKDRDQSTQTLLFLSEGFWEQQLSFAEDALQRNPNDLLARQQANHAKEQLVTIQTRLSASRTK